MRSTGHLQLRFLSEALGFETSVTVLAPVRSTRAGNPAVLYLLHGYSDDDTIWIRQTSLERYVDGLDLAVVMPAAQLSFYADMRHGQAYNRFIAEELPAVVARLLRISAKRSDTFIAGHSMGGYGALRIAFEHPERFGAAASLSGAHDIASEVFNQPGPFRDQLRNIFGDTSGLKGSRHDLFALAAKLARRKAELPRLFACCGTGDFLHEDFLRFREHATAIGLPMQFEETEGLHDWAYWDRAVRRVLAFLLPKRAAHLASPLHGLI